MGLEFIELLLEYEQEFEIKIFDEELSGCRTLGDLHRIIVRHLQLKRTSVPPAPEIPRFVAWFQLRDLVRQFTIKPERQVRPATRVSELIPWNKRRKFWRAYQQQMGMVESRNPAPYLRGLGILLITVVLTVCSPVFIVLFDLWIGLPLMLFFLLLVLPVMAQKLFDQWGDRLTKSRLTLGKLVRKSHVGHLRQEQQSGSDWRHASQEEVWKRVVEITSEILDIPQKEIHHDSELLDDLKVA